MTENNALPAEEMADEPAAEPGLVPVGSIIPGTLADLANRQHQGVTIIEARAAIINTARAAAIKMTRPEDWLLFRDPTPLLEVGYLQDCGCDRVRDVFGIDIFDVERPERQELSSGEFMYVVTGSGRSRLTQQVLERVEGGRASTDDFILKQKPPLEGAQKELAVRKAARANLDGNITRELSGLKSVPLHEILSVFGGDLFRSRFREGRGYGPGSTPASAPERTPQASASEARAAAPVCPKCHIPMKFQPAGTNKSGKEYAAFWGCKNFRSGCKETIPDDEWKKSQASAPLPPTPAPLAPPATASASTPPELLELQKTLMFIVTVDRTLDAQTLCKKYFITNSGQALDYDAVAKLRSPAQLAWIRETTEKIKTAYATLMPPPEPAPAATAEPEPEPEFNFEAEAPF
jgi:hypothetical protein